MFADVADKPTGRPCFAPRGAWHRSLLRDPFAQDSPGA